MVNSEVACATELTLVVGKGGVIVRAVSPRLRGDRGGFGCLLFGGTGGLVVVAAAGTGTTNVAVLGVAEEAADRDGDGDDAEATGGGEGRAPPLRPERGLSSAETSERGDGRALEAGLPVDDEVVEPEVGGGVSRSPVCSGAATSPRELLRERLPDVGSLLLLLPRGRALVDSPWLALLRRVFPAASSSSDGK